MIGFLGYNFYKDKNCVDPYPTEFNNCNYLEIKNGIFDEVYLTRDITSQYSTVKPDAWDYDTLFDAKFNGNLSAGSISDFAKNVTSVKIKRREKGQYNWITLFEKKIISDEDLSGVFIDNLNLNYKDYEYAWVPMLENVEGEYIVSEIYSKFDGVFICDLNTIIKFYNNVSYGKNDTNQQIGVYTPIGRKMPIIVSNSLINYQTGSFSGMIANDDDDVLDRKKMVDKKDVILKYLTNKKPKVIKDWNGNAWLCFVTGSPSISYVNNYGMGLMNVSFDWTEIGDLESNTDIQESGILNNTGI